MPIRNRRANSPDRMKPLSITNIHKAFHKFHSDFVTAGLMPKVNEDYAAEITKLLDLPVAVPTKFLRN